MEVRFHPGTWTDHNEYAGVFRVFLGDAAAPDVIELPVSELVDPFIISEPQ